MGFLIRILLSFYVSVYLVFMERYETLHERYIFLYRRTSAFTSGFT